MEKSRAQVTIPVVRYSYPPQAILFVIVSWVFLMALIAMYTTIAIALFPMAPIVWGGGACLVGAAHQYAISVRTPIRS
ncbi:MAG TPA: hypothetical protein VM686_10560 [Polyangiaceae bacterium]|jgi:hypothetical protein|nr:hypothetical protein [Polyangiaceae bacterium]